MIKEKIVNSFIPKDIIQKILSWKYPFQLKIIVLLMDISRMIRYYFVYWWAFKWYKNIEWIEKYNIPANSFNSEEKKDWISAYARLKNAWDFIIPTIESAIQYFDECILVENGSTDDTVRKCEELQRKYPEKITFYKYEPEVFPLFSKQFEKCSEQSVHSFSYMSNYALSKVSYKYALKIDDDQIFIHKNLRALLTKIRKKWLHSFINTPLINVQKDNKVFVHSKDQYRSTFSWLFWDIWFHPVTPRIYFHKNTYTEWYVHNYFSSLWPIAFLHLKLLKPWNGFNNYDKKWHSYLKNNYLSESFAPLEKKYTKLLNQFWIQWE